MQQSPSRQPIPVQRDDSINHRITEERSAKSKHIIYNLYGIWCRTINKKAWTSLNSSLFQPQSPGLHRPELIWKQTAENCLERFGLGVKMPNFLPMLSEHFPLYTTRGEELWPNSWSCCRASLQKLLLKEQWSVTEINVLTLGQN